MTDKEWKSSGNAAIDAAHAAAEEYRRRKLEEATAKQLDIEAARLAAHKAKGRRKW